MAAWQNSISLELLIKVLSKTESIMTYLFIADNSLRLERECKMFEMIKNPDLLELIFRYLDPASVKAASQVSR